MRITNMFSYFKRHSFVAGLIAIAAVVVMVIAGRVAARKSAGEEAPSSVRQVSLIDATAFRKDAATVSVQGTVQSVAQVDLKSQVSAPVSYVRYEVGDPVAAGSVILELRNDDVRAQLDQARAALALAEGQYDTGSVSVTSARTSAADQARNAYTAVDQAIHAQLDQFLFNSAAGQAPLANKISDLKLIDTLHTERTDLDTAFSGWKPTIDALSASSTDDERLAALAQSKTVLAAASKILQDVSVALNSLSKDTSASDAAVVSGWKSTVAAAQASITGATTAVTAADSALRNAISSHGAPAQAGIASAVAGVRALEAQLAKTIIVSPVTGKIAALPLRQGELASPGTLLASVVGGNGLEVKAYASGEDINRIVKGAQVLIKDTISGVVSSVAPSVSEANRRVEVTIAVDGAQSANLIVGDSVPVSIKAAQLSGSDGASGAAATSSAPYYLPIQDVKIVPGEASVFTVDENSKLVKHLVVLGAVSGDFVEVKSGVSDDMKLVSPVYELEEGDTVDAR